MTHEQAALWQKIRDFQIDAPNASYSYTTRLARENGWTPVYAERVVFEYRRFAFLAIASGHGATPSKAVDEAWHLHLLYTRNYWEEFCPQALGRPLHHNPADGGEADETKYRDWYVETLASYRRLFGEEPPEDVWPTKSTPPRKRPWAWLAIFSLGLVGCGEPANPLDWTGPSFLQLFAGLYAAAFLGAGLLRWRLRGPGDGPPAVDWRLHVYEEAYLNEGPELALATALARLHASGHVQVEKKKFRAQPGAQGDHPLDRTILRATDSPTGAAYETLRRVAEPTLDEMETSLRRQGLWVGDPGPQWLPATVAFLPVLLAGAKILVGMSRDRPVGFLILGCVLASLLNLVFFQPLKRSRYGDAVLEELRRQRGAKQNFSGTRDASQLALSIALFGLVALDSGPYGDLRQAIQPVSSTSGGGDSGGSSCSSSSCGGGSCGGGCGGCSGD